MGKLEMVFKCQIKDVRGVRGGNHATHSGLDKKSLLILFGVKV